MARNATMIRAIRASNFVDDDDLGDRGAVPVTRGDNTVLPQTPGSRRNET